MFNRSEHNAPYITQTLRSTRFLKSCNKYLHQVEYGQLLYLLVYCIITRPMTFLQQYQGSMLKDVMTIQINRIMPAKLPFILLWQQIILYRLFEKEAFGCTIQVMSLSYKMCSFFTLLAYLFSPFITPDLIAPFFYGP